MSGGGQEREGVTYGMGREGVTELPQEKVDGNEVMNGLQVKVSEDKVTDTSSVLENRRASTDKFKDVGSRSCDVRGSSCCESAGVRHQPAAGSLSIAQHERPAQSRDAPGPGGGATSQPAACSSHTPPVGLVTGDELPVGETREGPPSPAQPATSLDEKNHAPPTWPAQRELLTAGVRVSLADVTPEAVHLFKSLGGEVLDGLQTESSTSRQTGRHFKTPAFTRHAGKQVTDQSLGAGRPVTDQSLSAGRPATDQSLSAGRPATDQSLSAGRPVTDQSLGAGRPTGHRPEP
ncbi:uncharacterized protein LOC131942395 [Physella acuta]|uniref:uncharacterized protein LOC131942395 n=1 Tax=Physella acuta TaxID=109671 RepID=UPI0027DD41E2|nr:uncharacterized protein LOC131942395 [Physella acuta]